MSFMLHPPAQSRWTQFREAGLGHLCHVSDFMCGRQYTYIFMRQSPTKGKGKKQRGKVRPDGEALARTKDKGGDQGADAGETTGSVANESSTSVMGGDFGSSNRADMVAQLALLLLLLVRRRRLRRLLLERLLHLRRQTLPTLAELTLALSPRPLGCARVGECVGGGGRERGERAVLIATE